MLLSQTFPSTYISILVGGHFLCDVVRALAGYAIGSLPSCTLDNTAPVVLASVSSTDLRSNLGNARTGASQRAYFRVLKDFWQLLDHTKLYPFSPSGKSIAARVTKSGMNFR